MMSEPLPQHRWLEKLLGEWTVESQCVMGPDQPPSKSKGTEKVRSLGGHWVVCEGAGEMPGGGEANWVMTLGYDPSTERYVGTWVGSMMPMMWIYAGTLDADSRVLTLDTEGPNFADGGKTRTRFQDIVEIVSDDHRILRSRMQSPDGSWAQFMEAHYRRVK